MSAPIGYLRLIFGTGPGDIHQASKEIRSAVMDLCDAYLALEAKAAAWDALAKPPQGPYSPRVIGDAELAELRANARRWRTVERAVEEGRARIIFDFGTHEAGRDWRTPLDLGVTLAAAVDALQERMDKEAK